MTPAVVNSTDTFGDNAPVNDSLFNPLMEAPRFAVNEKHKPRNHIR